MRLVGPLAVNRNKRSIARPVQTCKPVRSNGRHASDTPSMIPRTVPAFDPKYSHAQREAIASAWNDRGVRPARRVVELARAGELTDAAGDKVPGFEIPEGTIRSLARHARRRRRGEIRSPLSEAGPRDAIEIIRRRLVNMIDGEMAVQERKRPGSRDPERIRQLARAALEAARLPGPTDPRPSSPATRGPDGKQLEGIAKGGLAGPMMRDLRSNGAGSEPAQNTPPLHHAGGEGDGTGTAPPFERAEGQAEMSPGALTSERVAALQQG
jgi:hypothetical protein